MFCTEDSFECYLQKIAINVYAKDNYECYLPKIAINNI